MASAQPQRVEWIFACRVRVQECTRKLVQSGWVPRTAEEHELLSAWQDYERSLDKGAGVDVHASHGASSRGGTRGRAKKREETTKESGDGLD